MKADELPYFNYQSIHNANCKYTFFYHISKTVFNDSQLFYVLRKERIILTQKYNDSIMNTSVKAFWLGHSAFKLESPSGKIIYIDPFLSQNPATPESEKQPEKADYILLTHGHEDHVGDTLEIAKRTGCTVVAQVELSHLLKKHGLDEDQRIEFNKGGTVSFDDFSVTLVTANHSSSFGGEYAGEAGGLVVSFKEDI